MDELDLELDDIIDDYLKEESKATVVEKQKNSEETKQKESKKTKSSKWSCTDEVKFNENKTFDRLEIVDPELLESLTERYDVSEDEMYGVNYESSLYNESNFNRVMTSRVTLFSMKNRETNGVDYVVSIQDEINNKKFEIKGFEKLYSPDDLVINVDGEKVNVLAEYADNIENIKYAIYRNSYNKQLKIAKVCPSLYKVIRKAEPLCTKNIWTFGMSEDVENEVLNIEKAEKQREDEYFEDYLIFYRNELAWKKSNQIKEDTWNKTNVLDTNLNKIIETYSIEDKELLRNVANLYSVKLSGMYRYFGDNVREPSRVELVSICNSNSTYIQYGITITDDRGNRHIVDGMNEKTNSYSKAIEYLNENVEMVSSHIVNEIETSTGDRYVIHRNCYGNLGIAQVEFNQNKAEYRNLLTNNLTTKNALKNSQYQQLRIEEKDVFDKVDKPVLLGVMENVLNALRNCVGLENKQLALPEKAVENNSLALVQYTKPSKIKVFFKYIFKILLNSEKEYNDNEL